jgi:hypothetical protein
MKIQFLFHCPLSIVFRVFSSRLEVVGQTRIYGKPGKRQAEFKLVVPLFVVLIGGVRLGLSLWDKS